MSSADRIDVDAFPSSAEQLGEAAMPSYMREAVENNIEFISRSLRRLGICDADVADAAQQVFLIAAPRLPKVRSATERAFLFQIAMRVAANARRTQRRRRETRDSSLVDFAAAGPNPEEMADEMRRRRLLDQVLDMMPMETRAVFVLSEIDGLTMAEIAIITMIPPGTVASRLRRGRDQFRAGVALFRQEGKL